MQSAPKDVETVVEFRVNFSALDVDTRTTDYLNLDRISPVLDARQPTSAVNQVCLLYKLESPRPFLYQLH